MPNETIGSAFSSNTRDKLIIVAITWIVTIGLVIVAVFAWSNKFTESMAVLSAISAATGLLGTAYKGNPTSDVRSSTAETTSTVATQTTETVKDKGS